MYVQLDANVAADISGNTKNGATVEVIFAVTGRKRTLIVLFQTHGRHVCYPSSDRVPFGSLVCNTSQAYNTVLAEHIQSVGHSSWIWQEDRVQGFEILRLSA